MSIPLFRVCPRTPAYSDLCTRPGLCTLVLEKLLPMGLLAEQFKHGKSSFWLEGRDHVTCPANGGVLDAAATRRREHFAEPTNLATSRPGCVVGREGGRQDGGEREAGSRTRDKRTCPVLLQWEPKGVDGPLSSGERDTAGSGALQSREVTTADKRSGGFTHLSTSPL